MSKKSNQAFFDARKRAAGLGIEGLSLPEILDKLSPYYISAWNALGEQAEGLLYYLSYYMGEPVPLKKLQSHMRLDYNCVSSVASRLVRDGIIKRNENGYFVDDTYLLRIYIGRNDPDWQRWRKQQPDTGLPDMLDKFIEEKRAERAKNLQIYSD